MFSLLFAQDSPIFTDKAITSGGVCAVLLILVWQLPSLIKLLLQNRTDVAAHMSTQSQTFSTSLDRILLKYESITARTDVMGNAIRDLVNGVNTNQEAIKIVLEELRNRNEQKHPKP